MDRILIILKKENGPRASSAPALGLNTIIFKHVYWYMQHTQVSVYRTIGPLVISLAWGTLVVLALLQVLANKLYKTYREKYLTLHNFVISYDIFISRTALESIILYLYHTIVFKFLT